MAFLLEYWAPVPGRREDLPKIEERSVRTIDRNGRPSFHAAYKEGIGHKRLMTPQPAWITEQTNDRLMNRAH